VTSNDICDPNVVKNLLYLRRNQLAFMEENNEFQKFDLPDDLEFHIRTGKRPNGLGTLAMISRKRGVYYNPDCKFEFSCCRVPCLTFYR
jgi:hypothetical protein